MNIVLLSSKVADRDFKAFLKGGLGIFVMKMAACRTVPREGESQQSNSIFYDARK